MSGTLIRTDLTAAEWAQVRKVGIDKGVPVSKLIGTLIRKHLLPKEA